MRIQIFIAVLGDNLGDYIFAGRLGNADYQMPCVAAFILNGLYRLLGYGHQPMCITQKDLPFVGWQKFFRSMLKNFDSQLLFQQPNVSGNGRLCQMQFVGCLGIAPGFFQF